MPSVRRTTLALVFLGCASVARARAQSVTDWRHDLDEIVRDIRVLHPDPFTTIGKLAFDRRVAAFRDRIPELTKEQRVVAAMRLVASIGDGHTQLEPSRHDFASWYPVRFYSFTDGLFVTAAERSVAELAGAEVLEIGGHPVDEVLAAARTLMGADNPSGSLENLFALHNARLMRGLGFASESGDLEVTVRTRAGDVVRQTLHPMTGSEDATFAWRSRREMFGPPARSDSEWISASPPAHLSDRKPFSARPLPSQDAYYARMDLLDDGFMPFLESIMKEVDAQKPRRLIIDWRYNFGGDGSIVPAIAREFTKRQGSPPWRELYILTGRRTFGAGVMAVHALLGQVPLTIVGEPAGSALNQFGDATTRTYDRTGLRLHVSTLRWQLSASDDIREFIPVDVAAPFSSSDYMSGRDPAVDPILRGDEMRSVPLIALAEGSPLARQTVVERRKEFAALAWWQPPTEIELREPCQALRAAKRYADALDVCGLNAELHPYAWSSWLNLGQSQRAAGRAGSDAGLLSKGLESYRCVLRVDPGNPEADDIKSFLAAQDPDGRVAPPPDCP